MESAKLGRAIVVGTHEADTASRVPLIEAPIYKDEPLDEFLEWIFASPPLEGFT